VFFLVRERARLQETVHALVKSVHRLQNVTHNINQAQEEGGVSEEDTLEAMRDAVGSFFHYTDGLFRVNI
jgi:hypothetical protein